MTRNLVTDSPRPEERVQLVLTGQDVKNLVFCFSYLRRLYSRMPDGYRQDMEEKVEGIGSIIFPPIREGEWSE